MYVGTVKMGVFYSKNRNLYFHSGHSGHSLRVTQTI